MKQESPRSSEKSPEMGTQILWLFVPQKSVQASHFAFLHKELVSQNA